MSFRKAVANMAIELKKSLRRNTLSEDGRTLVEAISTVIAEAENADDEITADDLKTRIEEAMKSVEPVDPEKVAEQVVESENLKRTVRRIMAENKMNTSAPSAWIRGKEAVRAFAKTIHNAKDGESFKEAWSGVLRSNGITGMAYPEQVEAAINTAWKNSSGLFFALRHVSNKEFRIMYSEDDTVNTMAHGHQLGAAKKEQTIPAQGKKISLQMIYKWLPVDRLTLAAIDDPEVFIGWVTEELTERLAYTIERTIIAGDPNSATDADAITAFESIGSKTTTDAWTTVITVKKTTGGTGLDISMKDVMATALGLNRKGHDVWFYVSMSMLTALMDEAYNTTGLPLTADLDEMARRIGVQKLIIADYLGGTSCGVMITPDLYYRIGGDVFGDTWSIYEKNQIGYMSEVACGGAIAGLGSTATFNISA